MVVVLAVGAADQRGRHSGGGSDALVAGGNIRHDLLRRQAVIVVVVVGVAHDLVARIVKGLYRLRVFLRPVAHAEKRGLHVVPGQNVDKDLGVLVAPGGVEADGAHFLLPLHAVDGQLPLSGGSHDAGRAADHIKYGPCQHQRPQCRHRPPPQQKYPHLSLAHGHPVLY